VDKFHAYCTLCEQAIVHNFCAQKLQTKYTLDDFRSDVNNKNSLSKYWKEFLDNFANKCKRFNKEITARIVTEFNGFKNLGDIIHDIISTEKDEKRKEKIGVFGTKIINVFQSCDRFGEMIWFASNLMEERAKYINHKLVNEINYNFRIVANTVSTTMRAIMTDFKNLMEFTINQNENETPILIEKFPGYYQTFIATREDLRNIVKLFRKLIEDNQDYQVNTPQQIIDYENRRIQREREYENKVNEVELKRRYAYYDDYDLSYNYQTLKRMVKNTEDIELKLIHREFKRRCSYYDDNELNRMLKILESYVGRIYKEPLHGIILERIERKTNQENGRRHDDYQDQNQQLISDSLRLDMSEAPSASHDSIPPNSFEGPVDLPILERVLPFDLYSTEVFNFPTKTTTSHGSGGNYVNANLGSCLCIPVGDTCMPI